MKKSPKTIKWTPAELEDITGIIDCGLAYGLPVEAIVTDLCDHFNKMNRQSAIHWINRRKDGIQVSKIELSQKEDLHRGIQLMRYESVYALAMERGDLKSALAAAKELGLMQGLYLDPPKPQKAASRTVNVETMQVLGIPDSALKGLDELSDEQLLRSWEEKEFTERQAKRLSDLSRGINTEEDDS